MIRVVDATPELADAVAADMRREDADEVEALGMTRESAVQDSLRLSFTSNVCVNDEGRPLAMWGAQATGSLLGGRVLLWFLSTNLLPTRKREVLVWSRNFVQAMQDRYATLECIVDVRYDVALRWVQWLGFVPYKQFSMGGTLFYLMQRQRG